MVIVWVVDPFAALLLLSVAGIAVNAALGLVARWLLRRRGEA